MGNSDAAKVGEHASTTCNRMRREQQDSPRDGVSGAAPLFPVFGESLRGVGADRHSDARPRRYDDACPRGAYTATRRGGLRASSLLDHTGARARTPATATARREEETGRCICWRGDVGWRCYGNRNGGGGRLSRRGVGEGRVGGRGQSGAREQGDGEARRERYARRVVEGQ